MLGVRISIRARCTPLCDKACQWLATGRWFSPGPPVSSTNKTDLHNITKILLEVALNTIKKKKKKEKKKRITVIAEVPPTSMATYSSAHKICRYYRMTKYIFYWLILAILFRPFWFTYSQRFLNLMTFQSCEYKRNW
jgi:hypothetical protein